MANGYHLFNTGDIITQAQLRDIVMAQLTMIFPDAATRTTALAGVLVEGMTSYRADSNVVEYYDGAAWVALVSAGGVAPASTIAIGSSGIGYVGIPQNAATTGAATLTAADNGKHTRATATRTITIDSNANLALPIGFAHTFTADSGATMTIAITTDTMYLAGPGTTGSRTLAPFGMATAVKTGATSWMISGNGLT